MTTQQKDIIYIDVEDDITAIIGKVKSAKLKIVALVPPKRTGVLQSAVNLRLLARAADSVDKRLVLITHNAALAGLAASADIPVAKTLQSRPEIARTASESEDEDEVIDGKDLPVGDHAGASDDDKKEDIIPASSISGLDIDGESAPIKPKADEKKQPKAKKGISVPDFGSFRKRLAIGGVAGVLLIIFFVWAIWFAPRATVVVSAKTTGQTITTPVTLGADLTTSSKDATIKSIKYEEKSTQTVDFDATGEKNIGNKATGTVEFSRQSLSSATIPAGTKFTAGNGKVYVLSAAVTVPASSFGPSCFPTACPGTADGDIIASESGAAYNGASGSMSGVAGVTTTIQGSTSGGTDKMAKVVSQQDIDKAKEALTDAKEDDALEKLKKKFEKGDIVIEESFTATPADPKSSPALDQEATDGKATLVSEVTYTIIGIARDEMDDYLDSAIETTLTDKERQRVYKNGAEDIKFEDFNAADADNKSDTVTIVATAQIGPKINEDEIKEHAKGKRSGEIIGDIKAIDGVSDVEVKFSPFWVSGVPDDVKKISVEFKLLEND